MSKPMYFSFPTYYLLIVVLCVTTAVYFFFSAIARVNGFQLFTTTGIFTPSTNTFISFVSNPIYPMFRYPINNTQLVFTYSTQNQLLLIFLNLQHSLKGFVTTAKIPTAKLTQYFYGQGVGVLFRSVISSALLTKQVILLTF